MSRYTKQDIINMIQDNDVEFIRLQFTDIFGTLKNVAITASQIERALKNECMFDGSAIEGFVRIEESDMYLYPDLDTFQIFPWRPQQGKVARLICDVYRPNGEPFEGDPRYILKRVIKQAEDMGYSFEVGPECEFFLFNYDEDGHPTTKSFDRGAYFELGPTDLGESARRDMCLALEDMGFEIEPFGGREYAVRGVPANLLSIAKKDLLIEMIDGLSDDVSTHNPDIILLDLGLPDIDGVEVIHRVRSWSNLPIIVISARSEDTDKIDALDAGADDYLTKPFSVEELLARLRVTQRRLAALQVGAANTEAVFTNGKLKVDYAAGCAFLDGQELHLTPSEYKLLCLLCKNVGKVLTHTFITQQIWGRSWENDVASLRVFMATLRKKLEKEPGSPQYIQTHIGVGYRMMKVE